MFFSSKPSIWTIAVLTKSLSRESLQHLRLIHPLVSRIHTQRIALWKLETNTFSIGLQTPRLKRLAEIVSAQAIAQQEKFDYTDGEDYEDGHNELSGVDEVEVEQ